MKSGSSEFLARASQEFFQSEGFKSIMPFQPDAQTVENISATYDYEPGNSGMRLYGNQQATLIVDDVPFSAYWQLQEKKFIFHPMVWGRYVHSNAKKPEFVKRLPEISEHMGSTLPNGGLAFFYPNHYPLSRMNGPEFMYSAISQSEALSGYLHAEAQFPEAGLGALTDRVRDALFLDHEHGGVDLGVAQLELPLMHANPEIILNGWLHSLFNMVDYSICREDDEVARYVERNLAFFLKCQDAWYDSDRFITKYSDTCPFRVVLRPKKTRGQSFCTLYRSRQEELPNYACTINMDLDNTFSGYDNRITARNVLNGALTFVTTCSGLFDTVITSDAPFEIKLKDSEYIPERASPKPIGSWNTISSLPSGSLHIAEIKSDEIEIFRGYPTNFAKANGKNFYHIQHIVALAYIANTAIFEDSSIQDKLLQTASKWYAQTHDFLEKPFEDFEPLQTVLDAVNRGKLFQQIIDENMLKIS